MHYFSLGQRALRLATVWLLISLCAPRCDAQGYVLPRIRKVNRELGGQIHDFTGNHLRAKRIESKILGTRRDLYVYTPPGYCNSRSYPFILWLHGAFGDEHAFFESAQIQYLDQQIRKGCLPAMIVACPDGTHSGKNKLLGKHSFYINGLEGRFADHLMCEVLPFVTQRFAVSHCREQRAVIGTSAGGLGAMTLALKNHEYFGAVATLSGALNLRYGNCQGDYQANFSPITYRWNEAWDPNEVVGKLGPLQIKAKMFISPVFGDDNCTVKRVIENNPADVLCRSDLAPGELKMLVAYGGEDHLNFDAQAKSFLWLASQRGIEACVKTDPKGGHDFDFFNPMQRKIYQWIGSVFTTVKANHEVPGEPLLLSSKQREAKSVR